MSIADGLKVGIKFTEQLVGNVTGRNPPSEYKKSKLDLVGAIFSSLNQYSASYPIAKAFDGNVSTYWRGTTQVNWIQVQLPEAKVVTQIKMYLGSYYIKTFTFSGSNDGETWVQLGGEYTAASSTTAKWYTFEIENANAYLYYKVDTLTAYNASRMYLYELEFYEDVGIGNETKFSISFEEYTFVPGGTLVKTTRPAETIEQVDAYTILLIFNPGNLNSIQRAVGEITIAYDGSGTLTGLGGPVLAFEKTFLPVDLDPKNNPNNEEHIEIDVGAVCDLKRVYYSDFGSNEHIDINVVAVGAVIKIDDI